MPRAIGVLLARPQPALLPQPAGILLPAAHRVRALVRQRRRGHAAPTRPTRRRCSWSRAWSPRCSGRSRCGSRIWPAAGCSTARSALLGGGDLRARVPADLLQPPGAQRRPDAGAGGAVAVRRRRRAAARAAPRLRDRRARRSGSPPRPSTRAGSRVVCLLGAFVCDAARRRRAGRRPRAARARAGGRRWSAFVVANPYSVLDFSAFQAGLHAAGARRAAAPTGQARHDRRQRHRLLPVDVHLGPRAGCRRSAALGGAVLLLVRRRLAMALVLLPAPIAFIIFMGDQQRFFGRWLMPIFPIVALLGAYGAVELVRWARAARDTSRRSLAGAVADDRRCSAQSVATAIHNDAVLSRPDTRNLTRAWMVAHVPAGTQGRDRAGRPRQLGDRRRPVAALRPRAARAGSAYPTWETDVDAHRQPAAGRRASLRGRRPVRADAAPGAARPSTRRPATAGW